VSSFEIAGVVFACLYGAAMLGMALRKRLPDHHVSDDSRKLLEVSLGIVGTMSGLVLGLLVAAATTAYNEQHNELLDGASRVVLLDRILAHYGPQTNPARLTLRSAVQRTLSDYWPQEATDVAQLDPTKLHAEVILDQIEDLTPTSDVQRSLKSEAIGIAISISQLRWLMFEQTGSSISTPLLTLLVFWFSITFLGFGIFAPQNATVFVSLGLCALAVSGAVFLMFEMYQPFQGLLQLSSAPLREALAHLGR
jgi:hypothetical protein